MDFTKKPYGRVYMVTNTLTEKRYIGITTTSIKARWASHCCPSSTCTYLHRSIKKYGKDSFIIEALYNSFSKEDLYEKEEYFILQKDTMAPKGYNLVLAKGFEGKQSEITCKKKSESHKKVWKTYPKSKKNKRLSGIDNYVENKKVAIVSVDRSTGEVRRYESYNATSKSAEVHAAVRDRAYCDNKYWFIDDNQADEYFYKKTIKLLKGRLQPENVQPIIAENIKTGVLKEYSSIYDTKKDGFEVGAIRQCFIGRIRYTNNTRWILKSEFKPMGVVKIPKTNGKSVVATHIETGATLEFITAFSAKNQGFHNGRIGEAIKANKPYKGYRWRFKD